MGLSDVTPPRKSLQKHCCTAAPAIYVAALAKLRIKAMAGTSRNYAGY
jgi:hypothetical protein